MSTAGTTSVSLKELIQEMDVIEETIKALNNEESEAVEVESELGDVAEKIKKLLPTSSSIPQDEPPMRLAAVELEMARTRRKLVNEDNSCNQIFVAFTELEREEETKQKLILIRQITKANTYVCSYGEGCKIVPKV